MTTASQIRLDGVIDMHVHTAPDVIQRTYNDLELTDAAVRTGARAIVMKGHHCATVARAALCNAYNRAAHPDNAFFMFGGLVLNREAGGLNPAAVQTALAMGAKVIWLPTVDAANEYRKRGKTGGIQMTDERGFLLPELREICKLIKEYDAVLVDTPPLGSVADGLQIAAHCDGAILVVRGGVTPRRIISSSLMQLKSINCPVLGTVLNRVKMENSPYYYKYARYGYYSNYTSNN